MTETTRSRQSIVVDGGRTLCFAEWGDPAGFPVFGLHGTPGGRLNRHPDAVMRVLRGRWLVGSHQSVG